MSGVRLEAIAKSFGKTEAVRGVSLDIADGEFVVFVGPSGCGKTTTLNIIAGLESPTAGHVYIGNDRVTDWEPRDRNLGMVFQSLALFPHLTVFDNIAFPLRIKRVDTAAITERVCAVAATVKVEPPARPEAGDAVGRRGPAGGAGPHHRRASGCLPHGRAAVEPRRQAAGGHAHRAQAAARLARRHLHLRHPRPGRGDDHGRPHRGHAPGARAAGGAAPGHLRRSRQPLRGRLLRRAGDELHRRRAERRKTAG